VSVWDLPTVVVGRTRYVVDLQRDEIRPYLHPSTRIRITSHDHLVLYVSAKARLLQGSANAHPLVRRWRESKEAAKAFVEEFEDKVFGGGAPRRGAGTLLSQKGSHGRYE
jgi:hypothetical protein